MHGHGLTQAIFRDAGETRHRLRPNVQFQLGQVDERQSYRTSRPDPCLKGADARTRGRQEALCLSSGHERDSAVRCCWQLRLQPKISAPNSFQRCPGDCQPDCQ